jgi:hypothetical protein
MEPLIFQHYEEEYNDTTTITDEHSPLKKLNHPTVITLGASQIFTNLGFQYFANFSNLSSSTVVLNLFLDGGTLRIQKKF